MTLNLYTGAYIVYCELSDSRDTIMVVMFFLFMNLMFEYRYTEQMHYHSLWFILNFLHEHKYWKLQVYIITVRNYKLFSFFFSIKSELCQVKRICFCFIFVCKALFIFIVDHYVLD